MIDLSKIHVMGVLNVTPDSFSDGGQFNVAESAIEQAAYMIQAGASMIDIGGESTRPNAESVSVEEELARVIPVIQAVRSAHPNVTISIDTSKPDVMRQAVQAGANLINDINALRTEGAMAVASALNVPVCLMHMQGEPRTMQVNPHYEDVVAEVSKFLSDRVNACMAAGIAKNHIILDVGFGFGKSVEHNLSLLNQLERFHALGCPLLVGMSRKSMLGAVTGRAVDERLAGSIAVATIAAMKGAQIIRVHDVHETVDAVKLVAAVQSASASLV